MTRLYNAQLIGSLAQSVEQRTFNPLVERSNRSRPTKYKNLLWKKQVFLRLEFKQGMVLDDVSPVMRLSENHSLWFYGVVLREILENWIFIFQVYCKSFFTKQFQSFYKDINNK